MTDTALQRKNMVESQVRPSDVTDRRITSAMRAIPREQFVPRALADLAYIDTALTIAPNRAMTAPRDLARLLQLADIEPTDKVLLIGAARGYTAAVLAQLAARVIALEQDAEMTAACQDTLAQLNVANVTTVNGPLASGAAEHAPYDVIVIDGAVTQVADALVAQLAVGGRLVCVTQDRGVGRASIFHKGTALSSLTLRPVFEAAAAPLPGLFETDRPFSF